MLIQLVLGLILAATFVELALRMHLSVVPILVRVDPLMNAQMTMIVMLTHLASSLRHRNRVADLS